MANIGPISEFLRSNALRAYFELDQEMMKAHFQDSTEKQAFAQRTARFFLEDPDLPLLFRVRTCMVLGCNNDPCWEHLEMSEQGARVAELIISNADGEPSELEQLHKDAKAGLKAAQEAHDKHQEGKENGEDDKKTEHEAAEKKVEEEEEGDKGEQEDDKLI